MIKAVVYTSNTGFTKEYAEILGSEKSLPVYELKSAVGELPKGTEIIYLGWLMAGTVKGYKKAARYFDIKALCAVGMAENGTQLADINNKNKIPMKLQVFSLQGGFDMNKLHGIYRFMMKTMSKTVGKALEVKQDRTSQEDEMLDLLKNGGNRVSKDNLRAVLDWYDEYSKLG